jgi:hypothetical protein
MDIVNQPVSSQRCDATQSDPISYVMLSPYACMDNTPHRVVVVVVVCCGANMRSRSERSRSRDHHDGESVTGGGVLGRV